MKTFLETWLAEVPAIFGRELSNQATLIPSEHLPAPATARSLAVVIGGAVSGRFTISADRDALHRLFVEAKVTEPENDPARDEELWRGFLQQAAAIVAQRFGDVRVLSIEDAKWSLGLPSAAYELRLGDTAMRLAFTDDVRKQEVQKKEAQKREEAPSAGSSARSSSVTPEKSFQGGVELLLDVELEASLRFGSREMSLNEVLDLGPGDVVELDRHIADPVDLLVGDKIVARGEVVLVNGSFGLRVLEVAEPRKCLESIRCLF